MERDAIPIVTILSKMEKIIKFLKDFRSEIILGLIVVLLTFTSYNLGKITAYNRLKQPITITDVNANIENIAQPVGQGIASENKPKNPTVVASKKSTSKLYHFTWCPGALKIAEANKVTFPDEAAAIASGYTLASNCKK